MTWGIEDQVVERFSKAGIPEKNVSFVRDTFTFNFPGTPSEYLATFRNYYGPTMNAFQAAEDSGQASELQEKLEALFCSQNRSQNRDTTSVTASFLHLTATVP